MHQPPIIPNVEGVGLVYGEVEHFLRLFNRHHIGNDARGAARLLNLIAYFEVACANPVGV